MSVFGPNRGVTGGASIVNPKDWSDKYNEGFSPANARWRQGTRHRAEVHGHESLDANDLALLIELEEKIPESWVDVEDGRISPRAKNSIEIMIAISRYGNYRRNAGPPAVNDVVSVFQDPNFTIGGVGVRRRECANKNIILPWMEGCFVAVKIRETGQILHLECVFKTL